MRQMYGAYDDFLFFFFSSRRRHTRLQGDWSSDVCSSDLNGATRTSERHAHRPRSGSPTMIVGVPRETYPGEQRVALVPAVLPNLLKAGLEVVVETGAGAAAAHRDEEYVSKGARLVPTRADVFRTADVITQVLGVGS